MPKFVEGYAAKLIVPEGAREVQEFDDALPGFGIRKFASGKASFFVKYSLGTQQRRLTLGKVVPGNLAEMRRRASTVLSKARLGQDTVAEKQAAAGKRSGALGELISKYLADRKPKLRPRYHIEITRQLERDWKPLHGHPVNVMTRQAISSVVDDIAAAQGEVAADRARSALSGFFGWAIERSFCGANPTMHIGARSQRGARNRVLTESEIVEVWRACADDDYGRIVKLLILTGQRRREIGDLAWAELDLKKCQIELPAERTKNGRGHIVPLSEKAITLLPPPHRDREHVFGRGARGYSGWSKSKRELDTRVAAARKDASIEKPMPSWRLHDLRRSFITHVNELGLATPYIIEVIANHVSGHLAGVAGVYNKALHLVERRQALEAWSAHITALVDGRNNNVVPIRRAR